MQKLRMQEEQRLVSELVDLEGNQQLKLHQALP